MKAVILVGGFGTRLRPYTFSKPKPLVPFVNKAIVLHQIHALLKVGVTEVILAVGHMPHQMIDFKEQVERDLPVKITFCIEDTPLGTAGPLALAREHLKNDDEPFFMLNSDVACEFPLRQMLNYHNSHGREGTILVTPVEDPSKYGLVLFNQEGAIDEFLEKPEKTASANYPSNKINAGIYLLNKSVLDMIPTTPTPMSIERQIFPAMVVKRDLYAMILPGYWMDVGQPKDFLLGTKLHLASLAIHDPDQLVKHSADIKGNVLIDASAKLGKNCKIGPDVVIGANCVIGNGVCLSNCTIMEGSTIESNVLVKDSIIGWDNKIKSWSHVCHCFFGADVTVASEVVVHDAVCCPHKEIKENSHTAKIIL